MFYFLRATFPKGGRSHRAFAAFVTAVSTAVTNQYVLLMWSKSKDAGP
jgi:hypothetical protein